MNILFLTDWNLKAKTVYENIDIERSIDDFFGFIHNLSIFSWFIHFSLVSEMSVDISLTWTPPPRVYVIYHAGKRLKMANVHFVHSFSYTLVDVIVDPFKLTRIWICKYPWVREPWTARYNLLIEINVKRYVRKALRVMAKSQGPIPKPTCSTRPGPGSEYRRKTTSFHGDRGSEK